MAEQTMRRFTSELPSSRMSPRASYKNRVHGSTERLIQDKSLPKPNSGKIHCFPGSFSQIKKNLNSNREPPVFSTNKAHTKISRARVGTPFHQEQQHL